MNRLDGELRQSLESLGRSMRRHLRPVSGSGRLVEVEGHSLINFAGNDYLGLSTHPDLKCAAVKAIQDSGVGAGSSRLVVGHQHVHAQAEKKFAAFKHADGALILPTGYMANLAVLKTLASGRSVQQPGDLILLDKLCHASLIDAAQATGARVRTYPHLDTQRLERLLAFHQSRCPSQTTGDKTPCSPPTLNSEDYRRPRRFIVTDSVFSMDGDVADLRRLCELARQYDAIMVVDEAHATGVLGASGGGLCELQSVADQVDVVVSTASKGLGGLGGIITGRAAIIETLVNHARALIYSTAVPPAQVAVISEAVNVIRKEPWRRNRLSLLARRLRGALADQGWPLPPTSCATPIVPLILGDATTALDLAAYLEDRGLLAVAIRPPTVRAGTSRVRLSLRADLEDSDLDQLLDALAEFNQGRLPKSVAI